MHLILLLTITIISAIACRYIATSRDASPTFWFNMGLIFGPFAVPFAFMAKTKSEKK